MLNSAYLPLVATGAARVSLPSTKRMKNGTSRVKGGLAQETVTAAGETRR